MCICTEDVQNNIFKEWLTYFACHTCLLINLTILLRQINKQPGDIDQGGKASDEAARCTKYILLRNGHFACPTHTFVCL